MDPSESQSEPGDHLQPDRRSEPMDGGARTHPPTAAPTAR